MSDSSRVPLIFMAAVFLLLGAIFGFIGGSTFLEERRYQERGARTEARVTTKALHRATADTETVYEISYRFDLAEGTAHEQTQRTSVHVWERVGRDSPLVVEYVSEQPGSARVVQDRSEQNALGIGALGISGVLVLIGVVLIGRAIRRSSRGLASGSGEAVLAAPAASAGRDSTVVSAPEQTYWPLARRSFGFWFGAVFLVIGLPFLSIGLYLVVDHAQFAREARSADGIVLTKEIRLSGGSRSRTKHYEATYRFTVQGETLEGRDELSHAQWQRLVEREPVEVLYRPQRPSSHHLVGYSQWLVKTIFVLLGGICTAVGGTFFGRAVRRARLEWRLRQHGVSTQGSVTELHERNVKINNVPLWRLHYEYRDFQGRPHVKTIDIPEGEAHRWKVGDVGRVLYDSARTTEAVWIGDS